MPQGPTSVYVTGPQGNKATPLGYQQLVTAQLIASASLTIPANATFALISVEGQTVRWRDDGVAPTTAIGNPLAATQSLQYNGNLAQFQIIETVSGATVNVNYYR